MTCLTLLDRRPASKQLGSIHVSLLDAWWYRDHPNKVSLGCLCVLTWVPPADGVHPLHLLQCHIGWQTRDRRAHWLGGQLLQQLLALPLPLPGVLYRVLQEHDCWSPWLLFGNLA